MASSIPSTRSCWPSSALPFYVVAGDSACWRSTWRSSCALVLVMWVGARRYALRHGRVRADVVVRVRDAVAAGRLQLRARRAVDPAGRGRRSSRCCTAAASWPACCWGCPCGRSGRTRSSSRWRRWRWPRGATGGRCGGSAPAAALPIAGLLGLNAHMFGSPFVTPYDRVLIVENNRWVVEPSHRTFFTVPFWRGLWTQLTRPDAGAAGGRAAVRCWRCPASSLLFRRARSEALLVGGACARPARDVREIRAVEHVELRAAFPAVGRGPERAAGGRDAGSSSFQHARGRPVDAAP